MEGFDTLTMSYLASPLTLTSATTSDPMSAMMPMGDVPDHSSNYDNETFVGSEDAPFAPSTVHHPQLKHYPSTFDDPFSDALSSFEPSIPEPNGAEVPSMERDSKLLSFNLPTYNYTLLDYSGRRISFSLSAQLHGMFFLAESPWAAAGEAAVPPTELTCYRRNLFQISGSITLPRGLRYILTEQGDRIPIVAQELSISATESVEGNPVKIISVPWKTPASNSAVVEDKTEKEPPSLPLDLMANQEIDAEYVTFPISWKRLQFRTATANNGRRKELQQHFVVRLKVMAALSTGGKVSICEAQSGAIIVRGRSPRNFQSRKDFPISGGGSSSRKSLNTGIGPPRAGGSAAQSATVEKTNSPEMSQITFQYERNDFQLSPGFFDWVKLPPNPPATQSAFPATSYPVNHQLHAGPSPSYAQSSPEVSRPSAHPSHHIPPAPINLSLTEEEFPKKDTTSSSSRTSTICKAPRISRLSAHRASFSSKFVSSPDESADLLYEYFPLGLDDWMPPVDAVYRPHVVHHTNLPPDPKAQAAKNRSKRYFSEDQS
ncbi:hypothetical protein GP486_004825 [Trichoglossum hirsutum]|uniref:NDT80 domain-containing protein n=1 Tax=Trichoglossum hirsutum TaxID=265104 RepID=A0A9P8LAL7_9PEZI|nr:hypothetical protein GP486_004825 [Trichoglossum hirsutum]